MWQCVFGLHCALDTCEGASVIEAFFEGEGRAIIKACCWKHRGTRCSIWLKANWFYYQCHFTWSFIPGGTGGLWFLGTHEQFVFTKRCASHDFNLGLSWSRLRLVSYHEARCGVTVKSVGQWSLYCIVLKLKHDNQLSDNHREISAHCSMQTVQNTQNRG